MLQFQVISWFAEDVNDQYIIKLFGVEENGESVSLSIPDFKPYFYIKVPDFWSKKHAGVLQESLEGKIEDIRISNVKLVARKDFWGFSNNTLFTFVRIDFDNHESFKKAKYFFEKNREIEVAGKTYSNFRVYEANIDPFIRLIHVKNLLPSGWIQIPTEHLINTSVALPSTCKRDFQCSWRFIRPYTTDHMAGFKISSFDIECSSSHGDFPVPIKDYRKPAQELLDLYKKHVGTKLDYELTDIIKKGIYSLFGIDGRTDNPCSKVYPKKPVKDLAKLKKCIDMAADDFVAILSDADKDRDGIINKLLSKFEALGMPKLAGDEIIAIGMTTHQYGHTECSSRHILMLGSCDGEGKDDLMDVRCYDTEADLLKGFRSLLVEEVDPDVVTGYNINGFDFWYMNQRAIELGVWEDFSCLGRIKDRRCKFLEQKLSSSALGDNILRYIDMHGRVVLDVMKVVQRDHKLDSYKLDLVASHFLGKKKNDVTPQDIFRLYKGSSSDRRVIADYCVQDCALCNHLIIKLEILANNIGMSNVCLVPLSFIFMRGQGIKIFSLVMKECKDDGALIPVIRGPRDDGAPFGDDSYEGAIVLEPKTGIYINEPVSVLDYASLYPSSMISENLSHDCIVINPKYDNLPGVTYLDVSYDVYDADKNKAGEKVCRYVQPSDGSKGLIPRILQKLLTARKATRKQMEIKVHKVTQQRGWFKESAGELMLEDGTPAVSNVSEEDVVDAFDPFQKAVLDGLQNAYKVTANSLYGQCGARTSPIYMKDIAACTTATGRRMILKAKEFLEKNYCANIVYGDSVTSYTPITIRYKGSEVMIETVENIGEKYGSPAGWQPCIEIGREDKEAIELPDVEVWSDEGWTKAHRLIRHQLAPHKKIIRVATHTGIVDVTDDHSLLRPDGKTIVKPKDLQVSEKILHADLPSFDSTNLMTMDIDLKLGLQIGFNIIPNELLQAPLELRTVVWNALCSYWSSDFWPYHKMDQLTLAKIYALASSVKDCPCIPLQQLNTQYNREENDTIKDLSTIEYSGFVYDFTTDNHKFAAGVGRIVVHNTDSIFCVFPQNGESPYAIKQKGHAAIMPSVELAMKASSEFRQTIKAPHDLEYEKTFWPFILLSKKRYVGNKYDMDDQHFKQNSMGIVLKRRDNAPIVKSVYGGIIDIILNKQDLGASVDFLKDQLDRMESNKVDLKELVITKSLRADYKDPEKIAHKVLAERMGERDPGNKPQVNDRIPFVYIQPPKQLTPSKRKILQGDRIEHIDYVRKNNIKPDVGFYITNQVMNPVCQLLGIVVEKLPGFKRPACYFDNLMKEYMHKYDNSKEAAKAKLVAAKESEVETMLFGPVLQRIENKRNGTKEITHWFKTKP